MAAPHGAPCSRAALFPPARVWRSAQAAEDGDPADLSDGKLGRHLDLQLAAVGLALGSSSEGAAAAAAMDLSEDSSSSSSESTPIRIGPRQVKLDEGTSEYMGLDTPWVLREESQDVESHCNFVTFRANTCVAYGKWMYEVQLRTACVQQIGWCTISSTFTHEEGVGDGPHSYSYDGKRKKRWNVAARTYGETWTPGDIISVCLDAVEGTITFFRNGLSLGTAFNNVRVGPAFAYFPAISLSFGERSRLNFGSLPFRFPVAGYEPLQEPPADLLAKASYLLDSFHKIVACQAPMDASTAVCCGHIFQRLGPMLRKAYVVVDTVRPFLLGLFHDSEELFNKALSTMLTFLEREEAQVFLTVLFDYLADMCRCSTLWDENITTTLRFAIALIRNQDCLQHWLQSLDFEQQLEGLFTSKLIGPEDLPRVFPHVWWEGAPEEYSQDECLKTMDMLSTVISVTNELHLELAKCFLNSTEPLLSTIRGGPKRSPCDFFLQWLEHLVANNAVMRRQVIPPGVSDPTVLQNSFYALCRWLMADAGSVSVSDWVQQSVPQWAFAAETLNHGDAALIGGTLSHIKSEMKERIEAGECPAPPSNRPKASLQLQVYDYASSVFTLSLPAALRRLRTANVELATAVKGYKKELGILERCPADNKEAREILEHAMGVFIKQCSENVRTAMAYRQTYLSCGRDQCLFWWMGASTELLCNQLDGPYFEFVPESYVECVIDCLMTLSSNNSLGAENPPCYWSQNELLQQFLIQCTDFFLRMTPRVVSPDLAGTCAVTIRFIFSHAGQVRVLERAPGIPRLLIQTEMNSFSGRYWVPSTDVLIRFWFGQGFAFLACRKAAGLTDDSDLDCASAPFREELKAISMEEQDLFFSFLNQLLNHLNLAITEFDSAVQEIQQATTGLERSQEQQERYRKVNLMCEIAVNLLRLLEAVVCDAPGVFTSGASAAETNLTRVVEVAVHLFCRVASGNAYQSVMDSSSAVALQSVDRLLLLSPIVGTLLGLMRLSSTNQRVQKVVLDGIFEDPSFSTQALDFLLGDQLKFAQLPGVTAGEVRQLEQLVADLRDAHAAHVAAKSQAPEQETGGDDDDDLCTICYAYPLSVTFKPCMHRSCQKCISRHLLNNTKCFFCNAEVKEVVEDGAKSATSSHNTSTV